MAPPLGQTITVVNKSGKVVSTSKHLINVFKEAKSAYRERKAEIVAERNIELEEKRARRALKALDVNEDARSRTSSKHPHRSKSHRHRGYTDSVYANDHFNPDTHLRRRYEQDLAGEGRPHSLARRHTDGGAMRWSRSDPDIDMDLAYGELPPPPRPRHVQETELRDKMTNLTRMLDEARCLQHSATTTIENLQKNPDALAAVALTLAEISNLAAKLGPGVLASLKTSFPAVVGLLASPQFLIAGGVAVGVTVVALGGFKVIKKINKLKEERRLEEPMAMEELEPPELSRIEIWRRGIADAEAEATGTTVDGEFITPGASRFLIEEGVLDEDDMKSRRSSRSKREKSSRSRAPKTSKSSRSERSEKDSDRKKKKKKEPSGLKMLFRSYSR